MAGHRKLGRPTDQRMALLRGLTTELIKNGKVNTTVTRAKEVRKMAEKLVTIAIKECENTITEEKTVLNSRGQTIEIEVTKDTPSRLTARRRMMKVLYKVPQPKLEGENKYDYKERTKDVNNFLIEKMFREIAPKYKKRAEELGQGGGYTRIIKLGPRKGDAAEIVILEFV